MKKLSVLLLLAIGMGLILFHSCQKEQSDKAGSEIQNIAKDDAMIRQIISFKETCKSILANPGLKSGGSMRVDSAVFYIEAAINYTYGINNPASDLIVKESLFPIYPDRDGTFNGEELAALNQQVIDTVTEHYSSVPWTNKIIILVDLEFSINHDDYLLSVTTLIGNSDPDPIPSLAPQWKFGEKRGACTGGYEGIMDAAIKLQMNVHTAMWDDPPPNHTWTFTNISRHNFHDPLFYPSGNQLDNYMDYLIYYASASIYPYLIDSVECISNNIEMPFYFHNYVDFCESLEIGNLKYQRCEFVGKDNDTYWEHELSIWVGIRWETNPN